MSLLLGRPRKGVITRGAEGWRIGLTKPPLAIRKARRRRATVIAKASRRRNRA